MPRGFRQNIDGSITLWSAEEFQVQLLSGITVGLGIEYHQSPDKTRKPFWLQLGLPPEQALVLARALESAALQAMAPPPPGVKAS
jgi:hypothetical protein